MKQKTNSLIKKKRSENIRTSATLGEVESIYIEEKKRLKEETIENNDENVHEPIKQLFFPDICPFCKSDAIIETPMGFRCKCSNPDCLMSKQYYFTEQWNQRK